jgi:DNA-binding NarL/FixJ family response regulator
LRVVLADDAVLVREGVGRILDAAGFDVVGQASDADELLALVAATRPDVAVVDIRMPPTQTDEGLRAAQEIRRRQPTVGILVLSQYVDSGQTLELLAQDPRGLGYLLKERVADVSDLIDAIRRVARGGSVVDPEVVSRLLSRNRTQNALEQLTNREAEVLRLMAEGRTNEAIAQRLGVSAKTIETHVHNVFGKLHLEATPEDHRRVLAVLSYLGS